MSDDNAEKLVGALVLLSQAIELAEESNDDCNRLSALLAASEADLTAERTRADKAETSLTNLEAGFKSFMRSHNQVLDENERLREVIKQVRAWNEHTDFIGLETIIAAAVPVEPQGDHEGGA